MKALLIDAAARAVSWTELESPIAPFGVWTLESRPIGRLPNGDTLWVAPDPIGRDTFSLGGSRPTTGRGFLVGKKDPLAGDYGPSRSDPATIARVTRFARLPAFEVETTPEIVTPEIVDFCNVLETSEPAYVGVEPFAGAAIGCCFENVEKLIKSYGSESIFGWTIWSRPGLFLTAEFHAVWRTPDGGFLDPTPKADGETRILFAPDLSFGSGFDFMKRPANRRFRLFQPPPDLSALAAMGDAQRTYERRQAVKTNVSLEDWIASKSPHPLASAIDQLFEVCTKIDGLVEVRRDGLHTKHPAKIEQLETEKRDLHQRILKLARRESSLNSKDPQNELDDDTPRSP